MPLVEVCEQNLGVACAKRLGRSADKAVQPIGMLAGHPAGEDEESLFRRGAEAWLFGYRAVVPQSL
jgi:hypothetical protein